MGPKGEGKGEGDGWMDGWMDISARGLRVAVLDFAGGRRGGCVCLEMNNEGGVVG